MPTSRHRITLPGVKPIQEAKPGYEYISTEQLSRKQASGFSQNTGAPAATASRFSSTGLRGPFPTATGAPVLDNGAFHKAKKLSIPPNIEMVFLPPYSPELNPVERFWQDPSVSWPLTSIEVWHASGRMSARPFSTFTSEAVASLTRYEYLVEAVDAFPS